jgi:hypothetical protein
METLGAFTAVVHQPLHAVHTDALAAVDALLAQLKQLKGEEEEVCLCVCVCVCVCVHISLIHAYTKSVSDG